jgi:hypothetical protein
MRCRSRSAPTGSGGRAPDTRALLSLPPEHARSRPRTLAGGHLHQRSTRAPRCVIQPAIPAARRRHYRLRYSDTARVTFCAPNLWRAAPITGIRRPSRRPRPSECLRAITVVRSDRSPDLDGPAARDREREERRFEDALLWPELRIIGDCYRTVAARTSPVTSGSTPVARTRLWDARERQRPGVRGQLQIG